jgi:hypothetical protein
MLATASMLASSVAGAEDEGLARGQVYSAAAVNKVCADAQQIVTSTNLEVNNVILSEWDAFVQSDAAPYSVVGGFPPLTYSPPEEPDLPLTSTQHVIYGQYGTGFRDFPQVVSCKMKNAAYLNAAPQVPVADAVDQSCEAVNVDLVGRVLASLTNPEQYDVIVESDGEVVIDDDVTYDAGFEWTAGFPDNPSRIRSSIAKSRMARCTSRRARWSSIRIHSAPSISFVTTWCQAFHRAHGSRASANLANGAYATAIFRGRNTSARR